MTALEKDRNRRYGTASAFAEDVQRYLHDQPVKACPPSRGYRFRKFARRNKAALAVGALTAASLVATVTTLAVSTLRIAEERNAAQEAAPTPTSPGPGWWWTTWSRRWRGNWRRCPARRSFAARC
jgi:hypothetical protein